MDFFGVIVDFSFWQWFIDLPNTEQALVLFALGGWVFIAYYFLQAGADLWVEYRKSVKSVSTWQWVLLAVDVPQMFVQTPKAVEQIFAHLTGSLAHHNVGDKFWGGKSQKSFSLEVISIEGYIQFLVRTELEYRDLVEASIYAQYPEAEITEVEDYIVNIPDKFPNDDYDATGIEFKLANDNAYPIRTYQEFEYSLSKEAVFSDPMAAILENFTRIGHGENLWLQIVVEPVNSAWKEKGIALAKKLLKGEAGKEGFLIGGLPGALSGFLNFFATEMVNIIQWNFEPKDGKDKKEERKGSDVTPGMRKTVEAIEEKISKVGFKNKLRVLYVARKEVYNPSRCISGIVGAMNQFHIQDRNAIIPAASTSAHYDPKHKKSNLLKTSFVKAYKARKMKWKKTDGYIMNTEEMATLWHFPLPFVKTPLLHKAGHKRGEAPSGLPIEVFESPLKPKLSGDSVSQEETPPTAPKELPFG